MADERFKTDVAAELVSLRRRLGRLEVQEMPTTYRLAVAHYLALPGLVGFWPMSSVQRSTGNVYDLSGQARTLTYNGNPTFNIYNNVVPYIDLDGTGDYLSRADETDLDVQGTESWAAVPGLTIGGWFWFDVVSAFTGVIGKWLAASRSYRITLESTNVVRFYLSTDGTNTTASVDSTATVSSGAWYSVVARFVPGSEASIFLQNTETMTTSSVPASIFNGTAGLEVGATAGGSNLMNGRTSFCFLCANALPDILISSLFQTTRGLFGV